MNHTTSVIRYFIERPFLFLYVTENYMHGVQCILSQETVCPLKTQSSFQVVIRCMEEMGNLEALVCDLVCDFQTFVTSADLWGSLDLFIRPCCHWAVNLCSSSTFSVPDRLNRGSACQSHSLQVYHICCRYCFF